MKSMWIVAAAFAAMLAVPATAKDAEPCGKDLICASDPTTVAAQMMRSGYQAMIGKDNQGDPKIDSAASGYKFGVYFYGCEANKACDSLQLYASFDADPARDAAFANKWNETKRFTQMAIDKDGDVRLTYDVATIGGLTRKNFGDVLDWWTSMLGTFEKFSNENPATGVKPVPTPAAPKAS